MTFLEILTVCVLVLTIALSFSLYKLYKFSMIILNLEDSIESCLTILDERYDSMNEVLEIPIFFDSVEVRNVIEDIKVSRDSLVEVANKLTENTGSKIETQKED
tara:strand:- start:1135 stop:1446 length:312 start_codon:yes stop_codon:yes gene_type:complete